MIPYYAQDTRQVDTSAAQNGKQGQGRGIKNKKKGNVKVGNRHTYTAEECIGKGPETKE